MYFTRPYSIVQMASKETVLQSALAAVAGKQLNTSDSASVISDPGGDVSWEQLNIKLIPRFRSAKVVIDVVKDVAFDTESVSHKT